MENKIEFPCILDATKKLILVNAIFLGLMSIFRLCFFFYFSNSGNFHGLHRTLLHAFILGARFDLSAISYINIPVTISLFFMWAVGKSKWFTAWAKALTYYYFALYGFTFFIMVVDFGFYSYFKEHINILIYGLAKDDTEALITTVIRNPRFLVVFIIVAALMSVIYAISRAASRSLARREPQAVPVYPVWVKTLFVIILITANALCARGTLSMFPLSPIYAEISSNPFINTLSVNGIFALGDAIKAHAENKKSDFNLAKHFGYENDEARAFADFLGIPENRLDQKNLLENLRHITPENAALRRLRPNVVVIVMESFGANLLRYDSKDFDLLGEMRRHFESDYVFHNFLPAGLITIHALETMILNISQRPYDLSVTQSKYAFSPFVTRSTLPFKNAGYRTSFLYSGSLGWRHLDSFLKVQGFDEVLGEGSMSAGAKKNEWGVYDEYLFNELYHDLSEGQNLPKFIMVMTTGNHPPYSVPTSYAPLPLHIPDALSKVMTSERALAMKRFITYQYANEKLGEFITRVKNSPLGQNTIIAVTGDHNFWDVFSYNSEDLFYRYSVPMYLYVPNKLKPKSLDTSQFASHLDVMPTLFTLALSGQDYFAMGHSLLEKRSSGRGMNSEGLAVSPEGASYHHIDSGKDEFFYWNTSVPGDLLPEVPTKALESLSRYYRSACVVSEYVIKNSGITLHKEK